MQSHHVKRVVSGALAASAVIAAVTTAQAPATASPAPVLQQPSASDALQEYRDKAAKAEKLNEEFLKAQDDLKARQNDLKKAKGQFAKAQQAQAKASTDEDRYRVDVDKFAGASFTSGAQLNKLSALLTGNSAQDFLDRSSALDVLATDKNEALSRLQGAVDRAGAAKQQATDATTKARKAKDEAAKIASDLKSRKERLDAQVADLKEQAGLLSEADQAAQSDTGVDVGPVTAPGAAAQTAVDAALSQRGTPYVWGGTSPGGFDCSGLMSWAYGQAGISLPRTSSAQATSGTPVSQDQLAPGDLVYFYSPVSHIGMYIGDGLMVHAPTSGDVVKVAPVSDFSGDYAGATRVA